MPPWLCPASQNDLMFLRPKASITRSLMFCRYWSSASATQRRWGVAVAAVGVAITRRYFSL